MKPNNPTAFPSGLSDPSTDDVALPINTGMTLRDYFAAKAMQALLHDANHMDNNWHLEAGAAYRIADAMLRAREQ